MELRRIDEQVGNADAHADHRADGELGRLRQADAKVAAGRAGRAQMAMESGTMKTKNVKRRASGSRAAGRPPNSGNCAFT
jgi:hypothetical protein